MKRQGRTIAQLLLAAVFFELVQSPALAQITPAPDGTNTGVTHNGNSFNINGGTQAGFNLFHSFGRFGLDAGQIANFLSNPTIANILGRVTGGEASIINGQIRVTGSNANLFLMNPAGIVFGAGASLNVPGSFTATTANGIGVGNGWFNASDINNYSTLTGAPNGFAFVGAQPGAIVNAGNLAVGQGQSVTLLGGTVINTGTIAAPGGTVTIAAVPGEKLVRITQDGSLLSLDLPLADKTALTPHSPLPTPHSLPQLLTSSNLSNATGITIEGGAVKLTGSGLPVQPGDIVAKGVTAETATLSAANNLTLPESQLRITGDLNLLATNTVTVRDSVANPVVVQAGRDLTIRGDRGIDILALNHLQSGKPIAAGRNLALISDGIISGDTHFGSGGDFRVQTLNGSPANFVSLYDPVISSSGNVLFTGNYTGASLKVEAIGNIQFTGNITINNPDPVAVDANASDRALLQGGRALILRAGQTVLDNPNNVPSGGFTAPGGATTPGSITVGGDISATGGALTVVMSATGDINVRNVGGFGSSTTIQTPANITARRISNNLVNLTSTAGTVTLGDATDPTIGSGGDDNFTVAARNGIRAYGGIFGEGVQLASSAGDIIVHTITAGVTGIDVSAAGLFQARGGAERANASLSTRLSDSPEIDAFLQSKGINLPPSETVTVGYRTGGANDSLPVIYSVSARQSGSAPAGSLNAPITLRFEGATRTLVDSNFPIVATDGTGTVTQGRILIQGGNGAFFLGPTVTGRLVPGISDPFITKDAGGNFVQVTAANFTATTILYRNETYTAAFPTADFPANISGLAGSIYVGFGSNQTLYGSNQSRVFGAVSPTSIVDPQSNNSVSSPSTGGSSISQSAANTVQRTFERSSQASVCSAVTIASATGTPEARSSSPNSTSSSIAPCTTTANDDTQILQILNQPGTR